MIERLRKLLRERIAPGIAPDSESRHEVLHLVTAALLVETARADFTSDADEQATIERLVAAELGLDAEASAALHEEAAKRADQATSLYEFTREINQRLDAAGKTAVLEMMWRVARADGRVDAYEQHLIRKVANLLHVRHHEYVAAKLSVLDAPD